MREGRFCVCAWCISAHDADMQLRRNELVALTDAVSGDR